MLPISVLIPTKNEEKRIAQCINSALFANEVVVVDSISTDRTKLIAESLGARVIDFEWNGKFPKKKQWALKNIEFKNEWILVLDADELVTDNFRHELESFFDYKENKCSKYSAVSAESEFYFGDKLLRFGHRASKIVLLRKEFCSYIDVPGLDEGTHFDMELHYQPKVIGRIGKFESKILHGSEMDVTEWLIKHIRYADSEAASMLVTDARKEVIGLKNAKARYFHRSPLKPFLFFVYSYFLRLGFLDGRAGLYYATYMAGYFHLSTMIFNSKYRVSNTPNN